MKTTGEVFQGSEEYDAVWTADAEPTTAEYTIIGWIFARGPRPLVE